MAGLFILLYASVNAQNLLTDGDFSTTTDIPPYPGDPDPPDGWYYFTDIWSGIDATPLVESGVGHFQINFGGWESWQIQLIQQGHWFEFAHAYRLSFDVKADADRPFGVYLGENGGNWTDLSGYQNYPQNATTEWKTITLNYIADRVFESDKFSLELGGSNVGIYFDNVILEDLGKMPISIGIIGPAVDNWYVDVDMSTTDEVIYTLEDFPLKSGYCKFRQNDRWLVNWGSYEFPEGSGFQDGPDIPVYTSGNYDITFNRLTGAYSFVCVNHCAPMVGLLGSAVPPDYGWTTDLPMWSSDGVLYTIPSLMLSEGEAKFRINDDPLLVWGGSTFPDGVAVADGPPIPVSAGQYQIDFNLTTGQYHFSFPRLGILGSALNGWEVDIDLETIDGITYTINNQSFTNGLIKFRMNDDWGVNWGGYGFPSGYAWLNGPDIEVMAGTYNVTFNTLTGEFFFEAVDCPVPGIVCNDNIYLANEPGQCGATVWFNDPRPTPNCGGPDITIVQTAGLPSGSFFPAGTTTNAFLLTNAAGETASCSFDVTVYDVEPPAISGVSVELNSVMSFNHKMTPITLNYAAFDNCGQTYCEIQIFSSEPENGKGDGNTLADFQVVDEHHILLRVERSGTGTGRTYYLLLMCRDEAWNSNYRVIIISVTHDNRYYMNDGLKAAPLLPSSDIEAFRATLWPNPSFDRFNLRMEGQDDAESLITIYDLTGRTLHSSLFIGNGTIQIGEELTPGAYILKVTHNEQAETMKLIKK